VNFLLDENVPGNFSSMLRNLGHEVSLINKLAKGKVNNGDVGTMAIQQDAIIITYDRHFLNVKKEMQRQIRVIYLAVRFMDPIENCNLLREKLAACLALLRKPGIVILEPGAITPRYP